MKNGLPKRTISTQQEWNWKKITEKMLLNLFCHKAFPCLEIYTLLALTFSSKLRVSATPRLDDDCEQSTPAGSASCGLPSGRCSALAHARHPPHASRDTGLSQQKQKSCTKHPWQPKDIYFHPHKNRNFMIRISRSTRRSKGYLPLGRAAEGVPVQLQIKY